MSTFLFILIVAGIVYLALFHKPHDYSEAEIQKWFSSKLVEIVNNLEMDIKKDRDGEYPHSGKQSFKKQGAITYVLLDKNFARFDISDKNTIGLTDIVKTTGYKQLEDKVLALGLSFELNENRVEGDGVETFAQLDEYTDDFPRYYTVTVSGW